MGQVGPSGPSEPGAGYDSGLRVGRLSPWIRGRVGEVPLPRLVRAAAAAAGASPAGSDGFMPRAAAAGFGWGTFRRSVRFRGLSTEKCG